MYIALLEDDKYQAQHAREILDAAGYTVSVFDNTADLTRALRRDTFDAFVLDWELPNQSGLEVLQHIRNERKMAEPVMMLTCRNSEVDITNALNAGADDYCTKPLRHGEFLARLGAVLRRSYNLRATSASPNNLRKLQGYVFNETELEVSYENTQVILNNKEFKLALFLFENSERILSRERLINEVWGHSHEDMTRSLDVHISWIRRKLNLGSSGQSAKLKTVYGYGYRLITIAKEISGNED